MSGHDAPQRYPTPALMLIVSVREADCRRATERDDEVRRLVGSR